MNNLSLSDQAKKRFWQHITGPRGGLFALGMFLGAGLMYGFMSRTVIKQYEDQIISLNKRVESLEKENARIQQRLEDIALRRLGQD